MEAEKIIQDYFSHIPAEILEKAKNIKLLITDIDGVLTDGGIIYDDNGLEFKKFQVKDGLIVKHLRKNRILIGAITGRKSKVVENRCEELRFDFHYHGIKDKGKKRSLTRYTYDMTDRHRGAGQILDKKATLKQIVETNISLGNIPDLELLAHEDVAVVVDPAGQSGRSAGRIGGQEWDGEEVVAFFERLLEE